jgi:hypothetical protein
MTNRFFVLTLVLACGVIGRADTMTYGDKDCLQQGCYGATDPVTGATLQGLAPDTITLATNSFGHAYPFTPDAGDFPGTDQIYVGHAQTGAHDGYSGSAPRIPGPQTLVLDYSSLLTGGSLSTLTLGIAADDFQFPVFGQPFTATVNGSVDAALTAELNALSQSGPVVQFFTIGLNPAIDTASHILTISIDEGGDGGDGWAVDFLRYTSHNFAAASSEAMPSFAAGTNSCARYPV